MTKFEQKMKAQFDALPEADRLALQDMINSINSGRGGLYQIIIEHDEWCPKLSGGKCCCRPNERIMSHEQY